MALCGARFARKAVYDTFDAVLEMFLPKVQQQSKFAVAQAKLSEELLAMNSGQLFDGLQLHDDHALDEEVRAKAFVKNKLIVVDGNWDLALDP